MDAGVCETEEDSPEACVSPEGPTVPSTSREMRNRAEKQRRDKLNAFIAELALLVPMVQRSSKKMDKTSILRLTATQLRIYQTLMSNKHNFSYVAIPKRVDQMTLDDLVCRELNGFLLVLSLTGKIIFVSPTVENLLGHLQTDLMGQSMFNITHTDDHDRLRVYLRSEGDMGEGWRKYFMLHLKRAGPRSETPVYEYVHLMGMHRNADIGCQDALSPGSTASSSNKSYSSSSSTSSKEGSTDDVLVFFVKISRPQPLIGRLLEANKDEYITRHLIDGRIVNCDQRISLIAGYMIEEVSGHSAFSYMHREDVRWVMIALRQMYDRGASNGSSCYRLISRTGHFIYLRTFGYLEIDDQGIVESFVCINTLIDETEGLQLINEMKKRYGAMINEKQKRALNARDDREDVVESPDVVEEAIYNLIKDLPSCPNGNENEDCNLANAPAHPEAVPSPPQPAALMDPLNNSPNKPYVIRIKTVSTNNTTKRPPVKEYADIHKKRQKIVPNAMISVPQPSNEAFKQALKELPGVIGHMDLLDFFESLTK